MTQKAGTYVDGELWLRCPYCGDSDRNRWKAHFSINGEGLYHCLRCKASGKLPTRERIAILTKILGTRLYQDPGPQELVPYDVTTSSQLRAGMIYFLSQISREEESESKRSTLERVRKE